ncbi:MAG: flagellar hook-length control protein FliK [Wujia sp.]
MNISDRSFDSSSIGNNQNMRIGGSTDTGTTNRAGTVSSANADIVMVSAGERFNGHITGITNDQVSILLDNNKTLNAHMSGTLNLNIGDALMFEVKENNGGNVIIHPLLEQFSEMKNNTILNILDLNGFSPTEKNYNIADTLMKNNMPVDKAGMQKVMQQSYKFPDASVDTLVSLNKLGIPVNEMSIKQYNDYLNNTHQLSNNLKELAGGIADFQSEILNSAGTDYVDINSFESVLSFNSELLAAVSDEADMVSQSMLIALSEISSKENFTENISNELIQGVGSLENAVAGEEPLAVGLSIADLSEKLELPEENLKQLLDDLKSLNVSEEQLNTLKDNSNTPLQLLNNVNELINQTVDKGKVEELKSFFKMDGYNKLLEAAIEDKLSLKPANMENPKEIDDLYRSIYEKTNKLMNSFANGGGSAGENLQQQAKNVNERMDFIQSLNEMYAYAQIPVKLNSNELNSELFVYMNKKGIKSTKEDVSALLHLDMNYLGPTDVHVSLRGNIVSTRFYVEDEISAKILDEHMALLEKAVNENGFQLNNEVITREPTLSKAPNAVVSNMMDNELEKSVKRYSFDVRM